MRSLRQGWGHPSQTPRFGLRVQCRVLPADGARGTRKTKEARKRLCFPGFPPSYRAQQPAMVRGWPRVCSAAPTGQFSRYSGPTLSTRRPLCSRPALGSRTFWPVEGHFCAPARATHSTLSSPGSGRFFRHPRTWNRPPVPRLHLTLCITPDLSTEAPTAPEMSNPFRLPALIKGLLRLARPPSTKAEP